MNIVKPKRYSMVLVVDDHEHDSAVKCGALHQQLKRLAHESAFYFELRLQANLFKRLLTAIAAGCAA